MHTKTKMKQRASSQTNLTLSVNKSKNKSKPYLQRDPIINNLLKLQKTSIISNTPQWQSPTKHAKRILAQSKSTFIIIIIMFNKIIIFNNNTEISHQENKIIIWICSQIRNYKFKIINPKSIMSLHSTISSINQYRIILSQ